MDKKDVISEILISLNRIGVYYTEDARAFLWEMDLDMLFTILKFLSKVSKFYSKRSN